MNKISSSLITVLIGALISACSSTTQQETSDKASKPQTFPGMQGSYTVMCNGKPQNIREIILPIARNMESQKISYVTDPATEWRDCSGNFLRFSSYLAAKCPDQVSHWVGAARKSG